MSTLAQDGLALEGSTSAAPLTDSDNNSPKGWRRFTRWQAFGIHLGLSFLAFSTLVAMMALYWFPGELFFIAGGIQGLKIVAMVDLILGPLLTLILWQPRKKELLMDLAIVACIQLAALAYGFHATYQQRTLAMVFADGAFQPLSAIAHELANEDLKALDETPATLQSAGLLKTNTLITPAPDAESIGSYLADLFNGYPEPHERSDLYIPFAENYDSIRSLAIEESERETLSRTAGLDQAIAKLDRQQEDVDVFRYKTRFSQGVVLVDAESPAILDYLPVAPTNGKQAIAENVSDD